LESEAPRAGEARACSFASAPTSHARLRQPDRLTSAPVEPSGCALREHGPLQTASNIWGVAAFVGYIASIWLANWLVTHFGLVPVGFGLSKNGLPCTVVCGHMQTVLRAPAGVFVAGAAFALRDVIQDALGARWVIVAILLGTLASLLVSPVFAIASGTAFLFSEGADFAVYTPLRRRNWYVAAVFSNTVGDIVDSVIFLTLAFGSLNNLLGLMVGKWYVTLPLVVWWGVRRTREDAA
jgi:uncharacterized PurR-regulated membrane protein YhhQ (DUF165 family)